MRLGDSLDLSESQQSGHADEQYVWDAKLEGGACVYHPAVYRITKVLSDFTSYAGLEGHVVLVQVFWDGWHDMYAIWYGPVGGSGDA